MEINTNTSSLKQGVISLEEIGPLHFAKMASAVAARPQRLC
jgi:hypothetical protein